MNTDAKIEASANDEKGISQEVELPQVMDNVKVVVRVRPLNDREKSKLYALT